MLLKIMLAVGAPAIMLAQAQITIVSAASGSAMIAPSAIASLYGLGLALRSETATGVPLPTTLAGVSVQVIDNKGTARLAGLYYASPTQINFVVPDGTPTGTATVNVLSGPIRLTSGVTQIERIAPGLFTAGANGHGPAAGYGIAVAVPSTQQSAIEIFHCTASGCATVPIDLGLDRPVYVTLFGTGFRDRSALANVKVIVNGVSAQVLYAEPQPDFPGLDQLNISLPLSLRGTGETNLMLLVDGIFGNAVRINIK